MKYYNQDKLTDATKNANAKLAGLNRAIDVKENLLKKTADEEEKENYKKEISLLKAQVKPLEEIVLDEYLKLCGRVEDENGRKILTPCDKAVGKEKIAFQEQSRQDRLNSIKK